MDNLTHSLAGAVLGQMGLKRKTGLAMPMLIIAANLPDIDAAATLLGGMQHLAIRRGITHGPIAMLVLPLILWGVMIAYDRWRPNPRRLPVNRRWLLALAYIGCLSHPALDWLNSYGIRLLEPFSSQWFFGDSVFIIDLWIWIALGAGWWLSRRRERAEAPNWRSPAITAFGVICAYIFANGMITRSAETTVTQMLMAAKGRAPDLVVANPVPVAFWQREMLWRGYGRYGAGKYDFVTGIGLDVTGEPIGLSSEIRAAAEKRSRDARAFLFWSRMPVMRRDGETLILNDQRFGNPLVSDRFKVVVPMKADKQ